MPNQHKRQPEFDEMAPHICRYWKQGNGPTNLVRLMQRHYDTEEFNIGLSTMKLWLKRLGLEGTRKQGSTAESIAPIMTEIKTTAVNAGIKQSKEILNQVYGIRVSRTELTRWMKTVEPDRHLARKHRRMVRHRFYTAGVNHIICFDQHDKWKRFGLYLHIGIEPMSGKIAWLKIWWTNSNPRWVTKQWLDHSRSVKGVSLITQSDLGSENVGIAQAQSFIRQWLDPSLQGTLQHKWCRGHDNIKPEIYWSILRRLWSPSYEAMLQTGIDSQWYSRTNRIQEFVFQWLAIPWLQQELDAFSDLRNNARRNSDRHSILPRDPPDNIYTGASHYDMQDFKVSVDSKLFDQVEERWAPSDHPVFELVPHLVNIRLQHLYTLIGPVTINIHSFWDVYMALLAQWDTYSDNFDEEIDHLLDGYVNAPEAGEEQGIPHLPAPMAWGTGDLPHLWVFRENQDGGLTELAEQVVAEGQIEGSVPIYEADFSDDEAAF